MTELQNNDLVSKLGAASPVEPVQSNQINFSDNDEMVANNQDSLSVDPTISDAVPQDSIGTNNPLDTEDEIKDVNIPTVEAYIPAVSQDSNEVSTNPIEPVNEVKMEDVAANNVIPIQPVDNGAIAGSSMSNIINPDSQKTSSIIKRNPRVEYWKGLASGVLVSIGLLVIGVMFFDNGSLLASATNSIKLTDDDTTNEIVKMENALAFGDSVSNTYIDDIISDSDKEAENSESEMQVLDDENIDSNQISSESDNEDDELNAKNLDDDQTETVKTDDESDEDNIVSDLEDEENVSLSTDEKSTKSKMAGSIVSIFDDVEDTLNSEELNAEDSLDKVSPISYKHVENIEDANWVISANCDNLHCGNISEVSPDDLVLCTEFRQSDKLDDNANRIGSNGICRYKDASELVHIEL